MMMMIMTDTSSVEKMLTFTDLGWSSPIQDFYRQIKFKIWNNNTSYKPYL